MALGQWRVRLDKMLTVFASTSFAEICKPDNYGRRIYWIYKPAVEDGDWGELATLADGAELPDGWTYAMPNPLPTGLNRSQFGAYIFANANRLPIIGA